MRFRGPARSEWLPPQPACRQGAQRNKRSQQTRHLRNTGDEIVMITAMGASSGEIYGAVLALSRSIAGRTDLDALLSGVAECLGRIVRYDHVGMILHDSDENVMRGHIVNAPANPV